MRSSLPSVIGLVAAADVSTGLAVILRAPKPEFSVVPVVVAALVAIAIGLMAAAVIYLVLRWRTSATRDRVGSVTDLVISPTVGITALVVPPCLLVVLNLVLPGKPPAAVALSLLGLVCLLGAVVIFTRSGTASATAAT